MVRRLRLRLDRRLGRLEESARVSSSRFSQERIQSSDPKQLAALLEALNLGDGDLVRSLLGDQDDAKNLIDLIATNPFQ